VRLLALSVLLVAFLAARAGLFRRPWVRWLYGSVAVLLVASQIPRGGVDFVYIKRADLLIAAGATLLVLLRHLQVPWVLDPRRELAALGALSVVAVVVYLNFFSFHGGGTWVHYHDVAHYYLGSKYFRELGYSGLYTAMVRAEGEMYGNRFRAPEARDLSTGELVPVRSLLARSHPVRDRFTSERWTAFREDVALFRDALGPQYGAVLVDHGFNPTPFWAVMGGSLANLVPAGSRTGVFLLTLLDPLLLAAAFAAVAWTFGLRTALLSLIYFSIVFGATFGWTGGAFLRYVWLVAVVFAVCCLQRQWHGLAGAWLALAATLRVFPAVFLAGIVFKAAGTLLRERRFAPSHRSLFFAFGAATLFLVAVTGLLPQRLGAWRLFREHMARHVESPATNLVGFTGVLEASSGDVTASATGSDADAARHAAVYRLQLATLLPAVVLLVALISQRMDDLNASLLALPLLLAGLNLASYYWVMLVLLTLVNRDRPLRLVAIFGLELASYTLFLFEEREGPFFVYRSLLLFYLLAGLHLDAILAEIRRSRRAPQVAA
jgi:hypothetical protein